MDWTEGIIGIRLNSRRVKLGQSLVDVVQDYNRIEWKDVRTTKRFNRRMVGVENDSTEGVQDQKRVEWTETMIAT